MRSFLPSTSFPLSCSLLYCIFPVLSYRYSKYCIFPVLSYRYSKYCIFPVLSYRYSKYCIFPVLSYRYYKYCLFPVLSYRYSKYCIFPVLSYRYSKYCLFPVLSYRYSKYCIFPGLSYRYSKYCIFLSTSSVSCLTTDWTTGVQSTLQLHLQRIFPLASLHTGSGAHLASYPMGTGGPLPGSKAWTGRDADYSPHLVPRSWMSRRYTSCPSWCLHGVAGHLYFYFTCMGPSPPPQDKLRSPFFHWLPVTQTLQPHCPLYCGQAPALVDYVLYPNPIFRVRLAHHPDDGGSKHPYNTC
jgi:hypothetical protein